METSYRMKSVEKNVSKNIDYLRGINIKFNTFIVRVEVHRYDDMFFTVFTICPRGDENFKDLVPNEELSSHRFMYKHPHVRDLRRKLRLLDGAPYTEADMREVDDLIGRLRVMSKLMD